MDQNDLELGGIADTDDLNLAKYQRTLLGKVGGPDGPPVIVLEFEGEKPRALELMNTK
jgi:hypothetical protein